MCKDECTNEELPHAFIKEAIADELTYLCNGALELVPLEEAVADPEHALVSGRRANCNKEDLSNPKCRGRDVAQEVNVGGTAEAAFYASRWAREKHDMSGSPVNIQ